MMKSLLTYAALEEEDIESEDGLETNKSIHVKNMLKSSCLLSFVSDTHTHTHTVYYSDMPDAQLKIKSTLLIIHILNANCSID